MGYGKNTKKVWYNNGVIEGMYDKPPNGWTKGRLVKTKEERKLDVKEKIRQNNWTRPTRKS